MIDNRFIFLSGIYVELKVLEKDDIYNSPWVGWFNNEKKCQFNQHHIYPNTVEKQEDIFQKINSDSTTIQLGILNKNEGSKICGVISLKKIDLINRNSELSCFLDSNITATNPYILIESQALMIQHGFNQLGLKKIYQGSFHPNIAPFLIKYLNFEKEGVLKNHIFKNGKFHNCDLIAIFSDKFKFPNLN